MYSGIGVPVPVLKYFKWPPRSGVSGTVFRVPYLFNSGGRGSGGALLAADAAPVRAVVLLGQLAARPHAPHQRPARAVPDPATSHNASEKKFRYEFDFFVRPPKLYLESGYNSQL